MAPIATYKVRTPTSVIVIAGVMSAVAIVMVGLALNALRIDARVEHVQFLATPILPIAYWVSSAARRVGGARSMIRVYADQVEVPHPSRRRPMVFRRGLELRQFRVRILGSWYYRGTTLVLRCDGVTRHLSTTVLVDPKEEAALVADLERLASTLVI